MNTEELSRSSVAGVVLAGGLSRRMGGGDKGLLDLCGRPMLAHVLRRLSPQVGHLAINANGAPDRFADFACPVIADTIDGFPGPLAGLLAGMRWAARLAPAPTHIVTVPGDAPLLPRDLVARLQTIGMQRAAIAQSLGVVHPVVGLWPIALADDVERALNEGVRKVRAWTDRIGAIAVPFEPCVVDGETLDPFYNANTPEDLAALRLRMARECLA